MDKQTEVRIHETGFTILYEPSDAAVVADIIIVHGLQGSPWRTWLYDPSQLQRHDASRSESERRAQHYPAASKRRSLGSAFSGLARALSTTQSRKTKKVKDVIQQNDIHDEAKAVYWPKDLLPDDCPNARILVWGYDTVVTEGYGPVNKANLFAHAKDLLYSLERQSPTGRNIIFVAHSLGGLLVKDVLRRAQQAEEVELNDVIERTKAVVFLGTPHRGSPGFAGLGEIARHVASTLFRMDTNKTVIRALGLDSPELELSRESFLQQWRTYGFRVKTFQESQGYSGLKFGILTEKIVPDISSSLDDPREHAETLQADHRNMTKFWGRDDPNYVKVGGELKSVMTRLSDTATNLTTDMVGLASETDRRPELKPLLKLSEEEQACLSTLLYDNMINREQNIRGALIDTCQWFHEAAIFKRWHSRENIEIDRGLLWVKGKPGSGKSTLMKHTVAWMQHAESNRAAVVAFYFNARGDTLEKTPTGLFRSILHQMCLQDPSTRAAFLDLYRERKARMRPGMEWSWDQAELQGIIRRVFHEGKTRPTFLFIDALDECDEQTVREVVYFFAEIGKTAMQSGCRLNICLSSRHYPTISVPNCPEIVVENRNEADIATYVRERFSFAPPSEAAVVAELESSIMKKAAGVFLWSVLVVDLLLRDVDRGQPMNKLTERLKQVPKTMEELYAERCRNITEEERPFSVSLVQWVLFGAESFEHQPHAFVFAASLSSSDHQSVDDLDGSPSERRFVVPALVPRKSSYNAYERTIRLINDASRGLTEYSAGKTVQFIHETTREFFLSGPGLGILDPRLSANPKGLSYMALVDGCIKALDDSTSNWQASTYCQASGAIFYYARQAEKHGGSNSSLLQSIKAGSVSVDREPGESILRYTSRQHLTSCVLALLEQGVLPDHADDGDDECSYTTPLAAAFHDDIRISGVAPDVALVTGLVKHGADLECKNELSKTPLFVAVQNGWLDLAQFLVESGANLDAAEGCDTPLGVLVYRYGVGYDKSLYYRSAPPNRAQFHRLLKAMLERGADPNHKGYRLDASILLLAVSFRLDADVIRLLIQAGADVNALDTYRYGALHLAAEGAARFGEPSDLERLRMLVEAGCPRTRTNSWHLSPLGVALHVNPELGHATRKLLSPDDNDGAAGTPDMMDLLRSTRTNATRTLNIRLKDEEDEEYEANWADEIDEIDVEDEKYGVSEKDEKDEAEEVEGKDDRDSEVSEPIITSPKI